MAHNVSLALLLSLSDPRLADVTACISQGGGTRYWANATGAAGAACLHKDQLAFGAMALQAAADFNARDATTVPEFATLGACDKQLALRLHDTAGSTTETVNAAVGFVADSAAAPNAVVSSGRSTHNMAVAPVLAANGILHVASVATSASLDDVDFYPRFLRTTPTDEAAARALCELWKGEMGFEEAFVLHVSDVYGTAYNDKVVRFCNDLGVVIASYAFAAADGGSIVLAVDELASTRMRVGLIVTHSADAVAIAEAMYLAGVVGGARASLICFSGRQVLSLGSLPPDVAAAMSGSLQAVQVSSRDLL